MTRPFLMFPDKRLRKFCAPIGVIDQGVISVWEEMLSAMYAMPGVGLAGPQLGEMRRLVVVDCSDGRNEPVRMANPEVLYASAKMRTHEEGSPNIPGVWANVERPRAITARYLDEQGDEIERDFVGLWATSVQHQLDHLNGKLFIDNLSQVKRKMLLAKHAKNMKRR